MAITGIACGTGACTADNGNSSDNGDSAGSISASSVGVNDDGAYYEMDDKYYLENFTRIETFLWDDTDRDGYDSGILGVPAYTLEALENPLSFQSQALEWLSGHPSLAAFDADFQRALFALATLYYSFHGDTWPEEIGNSWLSYEEDECLWGRGYQAEFPLCDRDDSRHVSLDIQDVELLDVIMPPEVSFLDSINILSLQNTNITTSLSEIIPAELGAWTGLESILLYDNRITGTIPSYLDMFADSLVRIDVPNNRLSGSIPTEIGTLVFLQVLDLASNSITGELPTQLGEITSLHYLSLGHNDLDSTLPSELGRLEQLEYLSLESADVRGTLPTELGLLTSLIYLDFEDNLGLTGTIPTEISQLQNLTDIFLGSTSLEGTFPVEICGNNSNLGLVSIDCDRVVCPSDCPCQCEN